jgi:3-isopropylmalate dehydrogenase
LGKYSVALIPGDGVGPELTSSAKMILQTINDNSTTKFTIRKADAGDGALAKYGKALPKCSTDIIQKSQVCLKGPVGESAADVVLVLRRLYDLYANVRPARSYPNIPNLSPSVDLVIIRENTEDVYLGWEFGADENTVVALRITSEMASRRIAQYGFKAAMLRNKKKE